MHQKEQAPEVESLPQAIEIEKDGPTTRLCIVEKQLGFFGEDKGGSPVPPTYSVTIEPTKLLPKKNGRART